jgi:hypothetical protein
LRETDLTSRLLHAMIINDHFADVKPRASRAFEARRSLWGRGVVAALPPRRHAVSMQEGSPFGAVSRRAGGRRNRIGKPRNGRARSSAGSVAGVIEGRTVPAATLRDVG